MLARESSSDENAARTIESEHIVDASGVLVAVVSRVDEQDMASYTSKSTRCRQARWSTADDNNIVIGLNSLNRCRKSCSNRYQCLKGENAELNVCRWQKMREAAEIYRY